MPVIRANRSVRSRSVLAVCGMLMLSACASKYAQVPPRLDLAPYGRVALVTFSADNEHADLSALATQRFAEALLGAQPGVELLEIEPADSGLSRLAAGQDAIALARAVGEQKDVPAVFVGQLKVAGMKPRGRLGGTGSLHLQTSVSAELTVRLISARTGGTIWRSSSTASGTVSNVALAGRRPSIAVRDPEEAYGDVVRNLVSGVTSDLRPTWVKQ